MQARALAHFGQRGRNSAPASTDVSVGERALAEPTNFGRMLGEDGIGCDGACRCGTRSATKYLHFCLLVAWRPRTTKCAKPRWSTSGASTVSGGFGCGVGFALMSPVGSGLDADQRAPSDRHLARTASFLFQLEKERLRDVVRDAEGFDRVIPGPQIHDSWALPQWGRVRFNTANRGGSSCRLRYHYARILMRRSCGVWPGEAKMALKPDGFWRLRRSMTVRRAPRRPRSAAWGFRSSGTGCCASTLAGLTLS